VRSGRCPICRAEIAEIEGADARWRPFCSERCRLLDLSAWTTGRYRIPGDPVPPPDAANDDDA
jgi:uncharacterized protein